MDGRRTDCAGVQPATQMLLLDAMGNAGGQWADPRWVEAIVGLLDAEGDRQVAATAISALANFPVVRGGQQGSPQLKRTLDERMRQVSLNDTLDDKARLDALFDSCNRNVTKFGR